MRIETFAKFILRFILKPLSFIPAILMMYIIFSFSSQDGTASSKLSYQVTYKAVSVADHALDLELTDKQISRCIRKIHYYVRKLAHFSEYFLLAVSIAVPLYVYGIRGMWLVLIAGILCVSYAALDESTFSSKNGCRIISCLRACQADKTAFLVSSSIMTAPFSF